MSDATATSTIPENQHVTGTVGQPLPIFLEGEPNVPPPGPGSMVLEKYDPDFLRIEACGWYPAGELKAYRATLRVIVVPLQAGNTAVQFQIRPRAINPLYMPVTVAVTISS